MESNAKAESFRARAVQLRQMAKDFSTPEARDGLLRIADEWDRLADAAERQGRQDKA